MGYTDKQIECRECGAQFAFTASEQEFYASKGYTNDPKRCPTCRQEKTTNNQQTDKQNYTFHFCSFSSELIGFTYLNCTLSCIP